MRNNQTTIFKLAKFSKSVDCFLLFGALALFLGVSNVSALDLENMKVNMLLGDYKAAILEGEKLITKDPHSDELYYILGICYLKDGNYLRASDIFDVIIKEFKGSKFKEEALLGLGDTYLLREDFVKAAETYEGLLNNFPHTKLKAQVLSRLSQVGFKKKNLAQGNDYLLKLKEKYPLAIELKQNQDICSLEKESYNYYSVQLGSFSKPSNANGLVQKLSNNGSPAYIEESITPAGQKTYRVKVGKFKTRIEAEELSKRFSLEGYPTKICP